jgi:peptidoglycan/LPS O-acetylase OafA/YrhL
LNATARRNVQLDVLRGVAILLVMGRHLELPRPTGVLAPLAEAWFRVGWLGVDLFFVLSGFLIGGLLIVEVRRDHRIDIPRFLVRRGFKLYPAYLVFIGYLIAMPAMKAALRGDDVWAVLQTQWHLYWPNLLFLQNYVGSNPAGHTWSLAVEEHFYLLLPLLLAMLAAANRMRLLLAISIGAILGCLALRALSVWTEDPYSIRMAATHLRLDALMCGVGLRAAAEYVPERFGALRAHRGVLVAAGLACWSVNLFIDPGTPFIRTIGLTGTFVGSAALLAAAYNTRAADFGRWQRVAVPLAALVAWIGVYSYSIYLWHVTAMGILEREVGRRLIADPGAVSAWSWLAATLVACGGAILVGALMSKLVEWPALRVRDRLFPSRLNPLPAVRARTDDGIPGGGEVARTLPRESAVPEGAEPDPLPHARLEPRN